MDEVVRYERHEVVNASVVSTLLLATPLGDSAERPLQVTERGTIDVKGKGSMQTYWLA
ncbi:MAG: hypothetical protein IPH49_04060 [Ignavibacteria bacterium]|nr:hypothetical protein [Ignavibacteria bacterium]